MVAIPRLFANFAAISFCCLRWLACSILFRADYEDRTGTSSDLGNGARHDDGLSLRAATSRQLSAAGTLMAGSIATGAIRTDEGHDAHVRARSSVRCLFAFATLGLMLLAFDFSRVMLRRRHRLVPTCRLSRCWAARRSQHASPARRPSAEPARFPGGSSHRVPPPTGTGNCPAANCVICSTGGVVELTNAIAQQAENELFVAYTNLMNRPTSVNLTGQNLGGLTLVPGVYNFSSSAQLTGNLTLNGLGNPNAVFIINIASALTTASASSVTLINGAQGGNVFWRVGSSATLGTTTSFAGDILALSSITLDTSAIITCGAAWALQRFGDAGYQHDLFVQSDGRVGRRGCHYRAYRISALHISAAARRFRQ